jgi:hypothetical protein
LLLVISLIFDSLTHGKGVRWGQARAGLLDWRRERCGRAAFASRGSLEEIAGQTSDPERALRNLLERDAMFTERLREETGRLELCAIEVDTTVTEDGLAELVREAFGL